MTTKLDRLLESIDPSRTYDKVAADVDKAFNSFSLSRTTITDWDEYENCLTAFHRHIEKEVLKYGTGVLVNKEYDWGQCSRILEKEFGPNGFKNAFEMVITGKDGGLYGILKLIAENMIENYAQNEISGRIANFLEELTSDEKFATIDEYLSKYGHLLPSEFTGGNAARLKVHFSLVLKEHPKIIRRMRQIGR